MEILEDFLQQRDRGFYCRYGDFYIDPLYPVPTALVSHAHADHASAGHYNIYCSKGTGELMQFRYAKQPLDSYILLEEGQVQQFGEVRVRFYSAGHILGSSQILMEYKGVRYLYTGDYKLQLDPTCQPLTLVKADVLITETTFADPSTQHPDPETEILKLNLESNILLGCYALGKAQRLTELINRFIPEKRVLVHRNILPFHRIYDRHLDRPLVYEPYSRQAMRSSKTDNIYLVPPFTFNSYRRAKDVLKAFASGWSRLQQQNDIELYLSDHVDWRDILNFIEQVEPKAIWTLHGDGRNLHAHFQSSIAIRDIGKDMGWKPKEQALLF